MRKFFETLISAVLYLWQLPQNLAGLFLLGWFRKKREVAEYRGCRFYVAAGMRDGISLGRYIVLSPKLEGNERVYRHEYGHTRQSLFFGPLYLPVIGVPSLIHAALHRSGDYYKFWTERWADRLGRVNQE